jgi:hypothetical protein
VVVMVPSGTIPSYLVPKPEEESYIDGDDIVPPPLKPRDTPPKFRDSAINLALVLTRFDDDLPKRLDALTSLDAPLLQLINTLQSLQPQLGLVNTLLAVDARRHRSVPEEADGVRAGLVGGRVVPLRSTPVVPERAPTALEFGARTHARRGDLLHSVGARVLPGGATDAPAGRRVLHDLVRGAESGAVCGHVRSAVLHRHQPAPPASDAHLAAAAGVVPHPLRVPPLAHHVHSGDWRHSR